MPARKGSALGKDASPGDVDARQPIGLDAPKEEDIALTRQAGSLWISIARCAGFALAAVLALAIWAPSAAHASSCTNEWKSGASGSWNTASNWSKGVVPGASGEPCITVNGTYTVTVSATSVNVKSLTLGGSSGAQTLAVESNCSGSASLGATEGLAVGAKGAVTLTNSELCPNTVTLGGPVTNAGTITAAPGTSGGARNLQGNLTNKGTLTVDANTSFNGSKATLTNEGAVDLAEGLELYVASGDSFSNGAGGSIAATGSANVFVPSGATFNQGAGTTSGSQPVIVEQATLNYTGSGASTIRLRSYTTQLSGNLSSGQSLLIEGCVGTGYPAYVEAASGFSNAGTITLTSAKHSGSDCGGNDASKLALASGTLTNTGTIDVEAGAGGARYLEGSLTNKGTLAINTNTSFNGSKATLTNEGAVELGEGLQLSVSDDGTFTNGTGGSIAAPGGANVLIPSGSTFNEGAGTTSGTQPVIVESGTLNYTGSGTSLIRARSYTVALSGNISSGQSLSIEGCVGNGYPGYVEAAKGFSNGGTITVTSAKHSGVDCSGNDASRLTLASGTLTNTGTIDVEPGAGGERQLNGSLTNKGTLTVGAGTSFNGSKATLTNEGAVALGEDLELSVGGGGTFTNGAGGSIAAPGGANVLIPSGSTFNEGAGTTSGTQPVIVESATLNYTGSGASTVRARSYTNQLTGNISPGQSLVIEGCVGNGYPGYVEAAKGFSNEGTIALTSAKHGTSDCGGNDTSRLTLASGTLTNNGTFSTEPGTGGERKLEGSLSNDGLLSLGAGTTLKLTGAYTEAKAATLETMLGGTSDFGALSVSGSATIAGTVWVRQVNSFKGENGQVFAILGAASRSGAFVHTSGATIGPKLYYSPVNTATGTNLDVLEGEPPEKVPTNVTKPTISGGTQQGQTIVLDGSGTWSHSPGEYSYQWLRCEESGSGCKAIAGATGHSYLLTGADAHHRISLQVIAYNGGGESAPAEPSSPSPVISALALHAAAGESVSAVEGASVTLDGSGSTPASEIAKYRWRFGDGAEEEGAGDAILHHTYATAGEYTAKLTVFRGGEESSASVTITVTAKPQPAEGKKPAEGVYITVKNAGDAPVGGATVLYVGSGGARIEAPSDSSGEAVLTGMPEGTDTVYVYKSGLRPAVAQVSVNGEGDGSTSVTLESGEIATAEVKSKELNYEEIVAAGINPSEPANQNVYKFVIKLAFIESPAPPAEIHGYVNSGGEFVGATGGEGGGGGGGWSCGSGGCESGGGGGGEERIIAQPEVVEGHPLIQWLILHGKAAVLKQFFEVSMIVQNLSPEPFELAKGTATLNLPEGLSLAPTTAQQSLTNEVPAVPGGGSTTTNWIIRGDKPGEYNVSANYTATLEPFDAPVSVQAALANPLKVWGKEAMTLKVKADEGMLHAGVPYHVYVGVENKSDVPLYNVNLTIEENPHEHFIFQPEQQFSELVGELKPGETFFVKRPYILIPDNESESVFNPALSSATFVGEKEHPGENIEKTPAPTMYPLAAPADTPGFVHLKWTPVPGAEGYEVFSTKNLDTLFTNTPLKVRASSSSKEEVTVLPDSATEAFISASSSESLRYAVSTIVGGHLELESSPVIEAFAPAPTTVALASSANPSPAGGKVTLTASVSPTTEGGPTPTGTVTFREGTTVLASAKLSDKGIATFSSSSLSVGGHLITAAYGGDTHNAAGESLGLTETIDKASTQVVLTSSASPAPYGSSGYLQAAVKVVAPGSGTPAGSVTFKEGTTVLATVAPSGGIAKYSLKTLAPGEHTITATYNGGPNSEPSKSSSYSETITKASTQVTLTDSANPTPFGSNAYLQATVKVVAPGSGTPGGTVTFTEGTTVLATVGSSGGIAKYSLSKLAPGEHTITATYNGGVNTESSKSSSYSETITKASTQVVLTSSANPTLHGSSAYLQATVKVVAPGSGTPGGTVTFTEGATTLATVTPSGGIAKYSLKTLAPGEHTITATYNGGANTETSTSSGFTETIEP
jgi:predicted secreted protein